MDRTMSAIMDNRWISWVEENIHRGCNPEDLLAILLKNNFSVTAIRRAMGEKFPEHSALLKKNTPVVMSQQPNLSKKSLVTQGVDHKQLAEKPVASLHKMKGLTRIDSPKLQLYTLDNFLTGAQCDELIKMIRTRLAPSTLTNPNEPDKYFRTSTTCYMSNLESDLVRKVDDKIAQALGIRIAFSEAIQAQRYDVGQEFKTHTDYFEPGTSEFEKYGHPGGNRTWTFMIYLKKATKGGATRFPHIDTTFPGKKGQAIIWNNLYTDGTPNRYSAHHGMPVEKGEKIVITKWFRELANPHMMFM